MRQIIITFCTLALTINANAQLSQMFRFSTNAVTNRFEKSYNGKDYELNYYNDDCIDYTLIRDKDKTYTLSEGKNTLFTITANDIETNRNEAKRGQKNIIYPGKIVNKQKLESIVYAMPVMNGKQTRCKFIRAHAKFGKTAENPQPDRDSIELKGIYFYMMPGDTICAVRSGVACQDVPNTRLYVYHDDGSIAIYSNIKKSVKHRDRIIAGQPIGTVQEGKNGIRVVILYLDEAVFRNNLSVQFPYTCYSPMFRTTKGDCHIDGKLILTPNTDDALRMQEMTKKEKKALLKK